MSALYPSDDSGRRAPSRGLRWLLSIASFALLSVAAVCGISSGSGAKSADVCTAGKYHDASQASSRIYIFPSCGVKPQGIGVDAKGNIWVVNEGNAGHGTNVAELSPNGTLIKTYKTGSVPHGIKINRGGGWSFGQIWVENSGSNDITRLSAEPAPLPTYTSGGFCPQHGEFDGAGDFWVTNQGSGTIVRLNSKGVSPPPILVGDSPHAISRDKRDGSLWVGSYSNGHVTKVNK